MTDYDPTLFEGAAGHYLRGRVPYSSALLSTLARELSLDGTGTLLDVGSGPGVLVVQLAPGFEHVVAVEPDAAMVEEARRHVAREGVTGVRWIQDVAEHLAHYEFRDVRLATFGRSFHWTRRFEVAESVYDLLPPGGSLALITNNVEDTKRPDDLPFPDAPDDAVRALIAHYLGDVPRPDRRSRRDDERFEATLARTRFGAPRRIMAPGVAVTRDVDDVVSFYLSTSFATPHLFGDALGSFVNELRDVLEEHAAEGRFSLWHGDTEILLVTKARAASR